MVLFQLCLFARHVKIISLDILGIKEPSLPFKYMMISGVDGAGIKPKQLKIKIPLQQSPSPVLDGEVCALIPFLGYYLIATEESWQFSFLPINSLYLLCSVAMSGTCLEAHRTYSQHISHLAQSLACEDFLESRSVLCLCRPVTASLGSGCGAVPLAA